MPKADDYNIPMPDLLERLNAEPTAWVPGQDECPDTLVCLMLERTSGTSDYGSYPLYEVIDNKGNYWTIHAFHTSLASQLNTVRMGSVVGIRKLEKLKLESGRDFVKYRVVTVREPDQIPPKKDEYKEEPF